MSGARDAVTRLQALVLEHYPALRDTVGAGGAAVKALREATDLDPALKAADALSLAAEAIAAAAKALHEEADRALVTTMDKTGCPAFQGAHHTVSLHPSQRVVIEDDKAVPEAFWMQPPPHPDKRRIAQHLASGATPNWASVATSVGLTRRAYK